MSDRAVGRFSVALLADRIDLVEAVAELRWREWGHPPEPGALAWWVDAARREAGREELPVTFVAVDAAGEVAGAVGLGHVDLQEQRDRSPWLLGMIVRADCRGTGVGRLLLMHLEAWAAQHEYGRIWVATSRAVGFYRACGWRVIETLPRGPGRPTAVLTKALGQRCDTEPSAETADRSGW
jgi:GNAT superfamily N-acetyltransferase